VIGRGRVLELFRRLTGWIPRIASGPGKGLRFDAGPSVAGFPSGNYEVPVQDAITSLLREGDVFYDIGANIGFFSVLAGRLVGQAGAVYAFEPVPENASTLARTARLNQLGNIEVLELAISHHTGRGELCLACHAGGASLKSASVPPDLSGSIFVDTYSIDDLVQSRRIRPPVMVKIDVEGAEKDVLQGMRKVLHVWRPTVVVEVDDAEKIRCEEKLKACRELLEDLQYRIEVLPDSYKNAKWFVRHLVAIKNG